MKLKCNYCKFLNKFPRVKKPLRCPRCGNPYGQKPKRKLRGRYAVLLAAALILMLVVPVMGTNLDFQNSGEFASYISGGGTKSPYWYQSTTGGNNYLVLPARGGSSYIQNTDPSATTYWAATISQYPTRCNWWDTTTWQIILLDSGGNTLFSSNDFYPISGTGTPNRFELKMIGGSAYIYQNDVLVQKSAALTQNPSYVRAYAFGSSCGGPQGNILYVDDYVYGSSENRNVFGAPEQGYLIKKDLINPAASGFCWPNGTIISNYNMTTSWSVGDNNASRTIQLKEWSSGNVAGTKSTTTGKQTGTIAWPIADDIINNPNAAYGFYITTIADSGKVSEVIPYIASGASVAWGSSSYGAGQPATITYSIASGGYWDLSTYTYSMVIADVYGNVVSTQPITTQTGSVQYTFTSTDNDGVYYAQLFATPIAGGSAILMNYATTELTSYIVFSGYVMNAETTALIIPAYVNITQGSNTANVTTSSVGWNSSQSWLSGTLITIRTVASGYVSDTRSFTPLSSAGTSLNISLLSTTPQSVGISIGGIVRDDQIGNPVSSASVSVVNGTSYNVATTNLAGFYRVDNLVSGTLYNVWSSKAGYSNSSVAQKLAVGV